MRRTRKVFYPLLGAAVWATVALAAAPIVDPPPPANLTKAEIERWAGSWGMKPGRFNFISGSPEGAYFAPPFAQPVNSPSGAHTVSVQVRFERFLPVVHASGKEVRSEVALLMLSCNARDKKYSIKLSGPLTAYVGHAMSGGQAGPGNPALWTQFAPKGREASDIPLAAAGIAEACFTR